MAILLIFFFTAISTFVALILTALSTSIILSRTKRRKAVGFFHPYTNDGGGGERVLWCAVKAILEVNPDRDCVVYTGDDATPQSLSSRAVDRFSVSLHKPPSKKNPFSFLDQNPNSSNFPKSIKNSTLFSKFREGSSSPSPLECNGEGFRPRSRRNLDLEVYLRNSEWVPPLRDKGFSLAKGMGTGKYIASDTFTVGGYQWAVYFYPDGKNPEDNSVHVSVFVALASEGTDVRALFELTLVDQSGKGKHNVHSHFDRALVSGPYTLKYRRSMWYAVVLFVFSGI